LYGYIPAGPPFSAEIATIYVYRGTGATNFDENSMFFYPLSRQAVFFRLNPVCGKISTPPPFPRSLDFLPKAWYNADEIDMRSHGI
jgi:hypothetical protein